MEDTYASTLGRHESKDDLRFEYLPADLHCLFLSHVDSPRDLYAFIVASPAAYRAFRTNRLGILSDVISNTFGSSLLQDALACVTCPGHTTDPWAVLDNAPDEQLQASLTEGREALIAHFNRWQDKQLPFMRTTQTVYGLYRLEALVYNTINQYTAHVKAKLSEWGNEDPHEVDTIFAGDSTVPLSTIEPYGWEKQGPHQTEITFAGGSTLSKTELYRLQRSFLKLEFLCRFYGHAKLNWLPLRRHTAELTWKEEEWEIEEMSCAFRFIADSHYSKLWLGFKTRWQGVICQDMLAIPRTRDNLLISRLSFPRSEFEYDFAELRLMTGSQPQDQDVIFTENLAQFGLGLYDYLRKASESDRETFYRTTYFTVVDIHRVVPSIRSFLDSLATQRVEQPQLPFGSDRPEYSNAAWDFLSAHCKKQEYLTAAAQRMYQRLSTIGWVFWDHSRLEKLGLLTNTSSAAAVCGAWDAAEDHIYVKKELRNMNSITRRAVMAKKDWRAIVEQYKSKPLDPTRCEQRAVLKAIMRATDGQGDKVFESASSNRSVRQISARDLSLFDAAAACGPAPIHLQKRSCLGWKTAPFSCLPLGTAPRYKDLPRMI